MNRNEINKFAAYLQKENWTIFGPAEKEESTAPEKFEEDSPLLKVHAQARNNPKEVFVARIIRPADLVLDKRLPFYSFKRFFIPECESIFEYKGEKFTEKQKIRRVALLGMNTLDLKAVNLYDQVFEKDAYYQKRRRNILIVGHSVAPEIKDNVFESKFEEDALEHLPFDIFLVSDSEKSANADYKVFTGSIKGQRILEHFGYKKYSHIQFSGPVKEKENDPRMDILKDKLNNKHNQKIWDALGQVCVECGKCSVACPTCFCFRIDDQSEPDGKQGSRQRCWDSCFYREFSEVSGGHKFLNSVAQRIHFWYYHKFARIPEEFGFMGCVGCHRCAKVCPVGIDIEKVLKQIEES